MSNPACNDNRQCRARAYAYLAGLIGNRPHTVIWDSTHCLQGHVHVGLSALVVIAPRDASHEPVVLTEPSWAAVRRCPGEERRNLIRSCAITDSSRLASALTPV
jgi:hypothetical protein